MNERKKVSEALRQLSRDILNVARLPRIPYWYNLAARKERLEDAKYLSTLANKNDRGTLTTKEADEILDILGDLKLVVYRFEDYYWVEIAK